MTAGNVSTRGAAVAAVVAWLGAGAAAGQPVPPPPDPVLQSLPITSKLYDLARSAPAVLAAGPEFPARMDARGMAGTADGRVNVEIVALDPDRPVDPALVAAAGGRLGSVWRGQTSAWVPPAALIGLARSLPPGYRLRHAHLARDNDEGPVTVGSDTYLPPGPGGQGIKVGIIDRNFSGLTAAETSGDAPVAIRHDYRTGGFESGTIVHGTAHLETVYDHAPDAEFHAFRIGNATDLGTAVDDAIAAGIHVLSATQSFYNEGWADDTGAAALAAKEAADNGILYVSSAGNRATSHWQGPWSAYLAGNWLDWDPGPAEDFSNGLGSVASGGSVDMYLQWDTDAGAADYNLYLYDTANNLLATSVSGGTTFEDISWTNNTGASLAVYAAVILNAGPGVELELFERSGSTFEHATPAGSLTSPNNNTAANCLVIGAVPYTAYSDGNIAGYSSRGPTNSGARGLDLAGPTNTTTLAYGGPFGGTSCATPNVAGTAVALWSSVPQYSADGVRILLLHLAQNHNDWGSAGPDPVYGYGGVHLPVHAADTEWVDNWSPNSAGFPELPWNSFADALAAVAGGRIIMMGGNYPGSYVLTQPVLIAGGGDRAVVGTSTP